MALTNYKFDSTVMPFTKDETVSRNDIENESQTEGGKTFVEVIREDVFTMKVSTTCLSSMLQTYMTFKRKDSFVLTIYDPYTDANMTRTVRMKNFSYKRLEKSEYLSVTKGIYKVSFNLEEF